MDNFTKFVTSLGTDQKLAAQFKQDPGKTMQMANLTQTEQNVILSGDSTAIRKLVSPNLASDGGTNIVVVVVIIA